MTLVRYEPWRLVNRLHQQLDHVFGDTFGAPEASGSADSDWLPAVDIHEEADRFVVRADIPGVERQDIDAHQLPLRNPDHHACASCGSLAPSTSTGSIEGGAASRLDACAMSALAMGPARCACRPASS